MFMVIDVESSGISGEGFAVGGIVIDRQGNRLDEFLFYCDYANCASTAGDREWLAKNVYPHLPPEKANCETTREVRQRFSNRWRHWADRGTQLVADCGWPVEARFLNQCVDDFLIDKFGGPYPFHELATLVYAIGGDPLALNVRQAGEIPAHHPLNDARQSARIWIETLNKLDSRSY